MHTFLKVLSVTLASYASASLAYAVPQTLGGCKEAGKPDRAARFVSLESEGEVHFAKLSGTNLRIKGKYDEERRSYQFLHYVSDTDFAQLEIREVNGVEVGVLKVPAREGIVRVEYVFFHCAFPQHGVSISSGG